MPELVVGVQGDLAADVHAAIESRFAVNGPPNLRLRRIDARSFHPIPLEAAAECDAVIIGGTQVSADCIPAAPRALVFSRWGVGYELVDVAALSARDIAFAISSAAIRYPTAEAILASIFALAKNVREADAAVRSGAWKAGLTRRTGDIRGSTLGSLGYGNIAKGLFEIARSAGFGRFIVYDHHADPATLRANGIDAVTFDELLAQSDFLAINVPLTEGTRGMIGAAQLRLMKPAAFLINTARGAIVDEAALCAHLEAGGIAGAAIDVFATEPPAADDPLLSAPRTLLSPHALAQTEALIREAAYEAVDNVLALLRGEVPDGIVNREVLAEGRFPARLARRRGR